jgi:hypothetical protein
MGEKSSNLVTLIADLFGCHSGVVYLVVLSPLATEEIVELCVVRSNPARVYFRR